VALVALAALLPTAPGTAPARAFFGEPSVYEVGAATRDITPPGEVNVGGNGLSDGSTGLPGLEAHRRSPGSEHIAARAMVVDFGTPAVIADIETQGMFAAYKGGGYGLADIAAEASRRRPALRPEYMIISSDHTHSGPDTIGAWGFVPEDYMRAIFNAAVDAIVAAYDSRVDAYLGFGTSLATDLVYNQNCTEALNQGATPAYTGPAACNVPDQSDKDAYVRVLQARAVDTNAVVATLVSYNAHATLGGADGVHGDWPQFLSDRLSTVLGGVGIGMEGSVGRVQPCRPQCSFTNPAQFGGATDRKTAYVNALMSHVDAALSSANSVRGPVVARRTLIREPITNPAVLALFEAGSAIGAELRRSNQAPWLVGNVIATPVTSIAIGNLLISGFPGEAYPNIPLGVSGAVPSKMHLPLGLANDQLGYLISPAEAWPMVTAEVAVNDNAIFNVSQTVGDHVMCASIANARVFYSTKVTVPPRCAAFGALDTSSDT
jgi:hypothetical protein